MAAKDIFIKVVIVLAFFNLVVFILDLGSLLSTGQIITQISSLAAVVIVMSMIPTTSGASSLNLFGSIILVLMLLYSLPTHLTIGGLPISIGLGLVTNITFLFTSTMTDISFVAYLFFHFLGLVALLSGIYAMAGGE